MAPLIEACDNLFYFGGRCASVLSEDKGLWIYQEKQAPRQPLWKTALKVLGIATLILPLLALLVKAAVRTSHTLVDDASHRWPQQSSLQNATQYLQDPSAVPTKSIKNVLRDAAEKGIAHADNLHKDLTPVQEGFTKACVRSRLPLFRFVHEWSEQWRASPLHTEKQTTQDMQKGFEYEVNNPSNPCLLEKDLPRLPLTITIKGEKPEATPEPIRDHLAQLTARQTYPDDQRLALFSELLLTQAALSAHETIFLQLQNDRDAVLCSQLAHLQMDVTSPDGDTIQCQYQHEISIKHKASEQQVGTCTAVWTNVLTKQSNWQVRPSMPCITITPNYQADFWYDKTSYKWVSPIL